MGATRREHAAAKRAFVMYDKAWHKNYASAVTEWLRDGQYRWNPLRPGLKCKEGGGND